VKRITYGQDLQTAAGAVPPSKGRGFVPRTPETYLSDLTNVDFTSLTAIQGTLSALASVTTPRSIERLLMSGEPVRLFVMGEDKQTWTTAAAPSTHAFTLPSAPIRTSRVAPTLPTNGHPDIKVVVTAGPDHVGTYLPVTVFADGSTGVTVDTSALTASSSYTVAFRYLPVGGFVTLQVAAPVGSQVRTREIINGGTRGLFGRDPTKTGAAITLPFIGGVPSIALPQSWQLRVMAKYVNEVPTLDDSDILIPARSAAGRYVDAGLESRVVLAQLGMA